MGDLLGRLMLGPHAAFSKMRVGHGASRISIEPLSRDGVCCHIHIYVHHLVLSRLGWAGNWVPWWIHGIRLLGKIEILHEGNTGREVPRIGWEKSSRNGI